MSISTYLVIILLAFLSGITTLIGTTLAFLFKKSIKMIALGIGISAGIMLFISVFELIPESIQASNLLTTLIALALGVIVIMLLNFIMPHIHIFEEKGKSTTDFLCKTACLVAFGLILHDFPEGFAMANSYLLLPSLGLLVTIGIAIHNIPEEFAIAVPLVLANKKSLLLKIAIFSALAEPAGAILGLFAAHLFPFLNPFLIAFAAGVMIYLSLHELLPLASKYHNLSLFLFGIFLSGIIYFALLVLIPH